MSIEMLHSVLESNFTFALKIRYKIEINIYIVKITQI